MLILFLFNVFDLKFTGKYFLNLSQVNVNIKNTIDGKSRNKNKTINWFVLKNGLFSKTMEVVKNPLTGN